MLNKIIIILKSLLLPFFWIWSKIKGTKKTYPQPISEFGLRFLSRPISVSAQEYELIETTQLAIARWNDVIPGLFEYLDGGLSKYVAGGLANVIVQLDNGAVPDGKNGLAQWSNTGANVYIKRDFISHLPLMIHEIGHTLGLLHSKDPLSVMYPLTVSGQKITEEIIEALKGGA